MENKYLNINEDLLKNNDFQQDFQQLDHKLLTFIQPNETLQHYLNTKNLSCPMPLLKLKMLLKNNQQTDWLYLTATDPNSHQDIGAFCQHLGYHYHGFVQPSLCHLFIKQ